MTLRNWCRRATAALLALTLGGCGGGEELALLEPTPAGLPQARAAATRRPVRPTADPATPKAATLAPSAPTAEPLSSATSTPALTPSPGAPPPSTFVPPLTPLPGLMPFSDVEVGVAGLRPRDWTVTLRDLNNTRLFIRPSEDPNDPNGLMAQLVGEGAFLSDDPQTESRRLLDLFFLEESERRSAEVVLHEETGGGTARLVAAVTAGPPGAAPVTVMVYARTELTARGLLLVAVTVPQAEYEPRRELLHQMVDALRVL